MKFRFDAHLLDDDDFERLMLGSLMRDASSLDEVIPLIVKEKNRLILSRMRELRDRGEEINRITLAEELQHHDELAFVGGLTYLVSLDDD